MKAFFKEKKLPRKPKAKIEKHYSCEACGKYKDCKSPKFSYTGKGNKNILIVDEFPSKKDDNTGNFATSNGMRLLKDYLKNENISFENDCYYTYALKCFPGFTKNDEPKITVNNINNCRPKLMKLIEELKPEKIILLGKTSLQTLLAERTSSRVSLGNNFIGKIIPDQVLKAHILPLWNTSFITDEKYNKVERLFTKVYLNRLLSIKNFYTHNYESESIFIDNVKDGIKVLKDFQKKDRIAIDYETSGIKPHADGHKIYCIGISDGVMSYGIPIFDNPDFKRELKRLLISSRIKKYGYNIKFETQWTNFIFKHNINGWLFDGMIGAHLLDNTPKTTSLKFQSYVNYGIMGYDDKIDYYIKAENNKNANSFNRIDDLLETKDGLKDLCTYCAIDAHLTYKLCSEMKSKMDSDILLRGGYKLFHDGILALAEIENYGIVIDENKIKENKKLIDIKISDIRKEIMECEEVKQFPRKGFKFTSTKDLQELLFDILKYKYKKKTKTGLSTDEDSLKFIIEKHNSFLCTKILEVKKLQKINNTYLSGIERETINGIIHNFFNLHTVQTFRGSSSSVNFQNQPKHDKYAKSMVRSCFRARKGNFLAELDYGQLEVRVASAYSLDASLLIYIQDKDMHGDMACFVYFRNKGDKELKEYDERQNVKSDFIFAEFYGDWYKPCAKNLWEHTHPETKKHLAKHGIKTFIQFEARLKKAEDKLWKDMFPDYKKFRDTTHKKYERRGFIDIKTGFRSIGVFRKNQILNQPIQGSGFHMLLFSLIELHKWLKENNMKTKIIGQIHDSIVLDVYPPEWETVKENAKEIMTNKVRKKWKFLENIPLLVEADVYKTDGSWYDYEKEKSGEL